MRQEIAANRAVFGGPPLSQKQKPAPPREPTWEEEVAERKLRSDIAWLRFELAMLQSWPQRKAGFKEDQPRVPPGHGRESGRWTAGAGTGPGIGHNSGIPPDRPEDTRDRTRFIRAASQLLRLVPLAARLTALGTIISGAVWLRQYRDEIITNLDPPKTLRELQDAVNIPRGGTHVHHINERQSSLDDGLPEQLINGPDNLVRIPAQKHRQITGWYQTGQVEFGGLSPREYLRGTSWEMRREMGLRALRDIGVLKP